MWNRLNTPIKRQELQQTQVWSLGQEDLQEEEMAISSQFYCKLQNVQKKKIMEYN